MDGFMKKTIKYLISFLFLTIGFWLLLIFLGEHELMEYFRNNWLWWDVSFSALVSLLCIFFVILLIAMFQLKIPKHKESGKKETNKSV